MTAPWSSPRWQGSHCHLAHNGALVSLDMAKMDSLWRLRKPGDGQVVTALEALDDRGQWLWTLSAGDEESQWRALLKDSVIRERRATSDGIGKSRNVLRRYVSTVLLPHGGR